jgi:hypothetical protein
MGFAGHIRLISTLNQCGSVIFIEYRAWFLHVCYVRFATHSNYRRLN